ncbi:hypothetical protein [Glaciihabitans sp. UYNi722]|uniref:hypothetical protein n=1 Tax=Glaciihabitans sp. UYNi722 TaxID=3156344 RepID=UPI003391CF8C
MTTYTATPVSALTTGNKVRALATVGPSVSMPGAEEYPWTVARIDRVDVLGTLQVWAHPYGSSISRVSPALYGTFYPDATVLVVT